MKKSFFFVTMISLPLHSALATPPSFFGGINASINIKNTTPSEVTVTCKVGTTNQGNYTLSTPYTMKESEAHTFTGTVGDGCSLGNQSNPDFNKIHCDYTSGSGSGYFEIHACQNSTTPTRDNNYQITYSNSTPIASNIVTPPNAYACTSSDCKYYIDQPPKDNGKCSSNENTASKSYCNVTAYFAVGNEGAVGSTYTLTWDNIKMNLSKGQTTADKLAAVLKNTGTYGNPIASYNGETLTIILPPPTTPQPNPYDGDTNTSQCKDDFQP